MFGRKQTGNAQYGYPSPPWPCWEEDHPPTENASCHFKEAFAANTRAKSAYKTAYEAFHSLPKHLIENPPQCSNADRLYLDMRGASEKYRNSQRTFFEVRQMEARCNPNGIPIKPPPPKSESHLRWEAMGVDEHIDTMLRVRDRVAQSIGGPMNGDLADMMMHGLMAYLKATGAYPVKQAT